LVLLTKRLVAAAKFLVAATKILFVVPNFVAVTKPFFPVKQDFLNNDRKVDFVIEAQLRLLQLKNLQLSY